MATRDTTKRDGARHGLSMMLFAAAATGAAGVAWAETQFEPEITAGIIRTDNLTLAPEGEEESQTVYELSPSFDLTQESPRLQTNVAYSLEAFYYGGREDSDVYHQLDSDLRAALDPDNFFITMGASRSQAIRNPASPISTSNLPIIANRIDRDEVFIGPELQYPIGRNVNLEAAYRRSRVKYDDNPDFPLQFPAEFDFDTVGVSVDNYSRGRGLSWALRYNGQRTEYEAQMPWEYRQAALELGAWFGASVRGFVAGGKESAWDRPFDPSLEDNFWEAGFEVLSGERLQIELAAGERSFGSSRRGSVNWNFSRGTMLLSYTEQPTTAGRDPYGLGSVLLPEEPVDYLTTPGLAERFLSRRFYWNTSVELNRTTISFTAYDDLREERLLLDGTPAEDERQTGVSFGISWQAGARTTFAFDVQRVQREFEAVDESDFSSVGFSVDYRLGARTLLRGRLARTSEEFTGDRPETRDYTANLLSLLLTRTF